MWVALMVTYWVGCWDAQKAEQWAALMGCKRADRKAHPRAEPWAECWDFP